LYYEHLEHNHSHLDDNVIRRRDISNSLKRKAQEKPAKLLRSQLESKDLNLLTTQDINAIRKSVHYVRSKSLPKLLKSTEEAQDSLDKIDIKTLANFLFLNDKA
jgi:hypothetical protein